MLSTGRVLAKGTESQSVSGSQPRRDFMQVCERSGAEAITVPGPPGKRARVGFDVPLAEVASAVS